MLLAYQRLGPRTYLHSPSIATSVPVVSAGPDIDKTLIWTPKGIEVKFTIQNPRNETLRRVRITSATFGAYHAVGTPGVVKSIPPYGVKTLTLRIPGMKKPEAGRSSFDYDYEYMSSGGASTLQSGP